MITNKYTLQVPEYIKDKDGKMNKSGKMLLEFPEESFEFSPISSKFDKYRNANIHQLLDGKILIEWL